MEKKGKSGLYPREKLKLLARLQRALLLLIFFSLPIVSFGQEKKFTFSFKHVPISTVYLHIEKNSDYSFVYNTQEVQRIGLKDYKFENASIREILDYCLKGTDLTYEIRDKHIIIHRDYQKNGPEEMVVVRGKVVGTDNVVLPGVTVLLKGTVTGVTTDAEGKYSIFVPKKGATLIFSFVGMKTKEVICGDKREINVTLEEDVQAMEEVVVTGYQTLRKSDVVGSVTTVKASDVMMPAYTSIDQMLQGRVAGVMVMNTSSRVGTSPKIRIRGTSTILGNQDPLWVVDGVIQPDPLPLNQDDMMVDDLKNILGNQISWLNPADIETITVLKDASATAIYGSKAANGVIVITTKRGQTDRMTVNYNGTFSFRARPHYGLFNLMNSEERIQFSREAFAAGAVYQNVPVESLNTYEGIMTLFYAKQISKEEAEMAIQRLGQTNTDWFKLLTRNSFSHNHNLSISGGSEKIVYNVSLGYSDQAGVEKDNDAKNLIDARFEGWDEDTRQYRYVNVGQARIRGLETTLGWHLGDRVEAKLISTWMDAEDAVSHTRLPQRPSFSQVWQLSYDDHRDNGWSAMLWDQLYLDYVTEGFVPGSAAETTSYNVLNMTVARKLGRNSRIYGSIRNLLDRQDERCDLEGRFWSVGVSHSF